MTILFYQNLILPSSQSTLSIQKNKKGIENLILKFSFLPLSILFPEQITKATKSLLRRYGLILVTCFSCQSKAVSARYVKVFLTYFFKDIFESLITDYEPLRKTFHGFYIYAIDGDQLALPRSKDLLKEGYCGYPCPNEMETHFLRMYLSHAYDVLSGVTKESLLFSRPQRNRQCYSNDR